MGRFNIRELAETVKNVEGYQGMIELDTSKPDATPGKLMGVGRLHGMGWQAGIKLSHGLTHAYLNYLNMRVIS